MLSNEINNNFVTPSNEATVKLYTDVSKKSLGIEPKLFYPTTSLWLTLPDVSKNYLTQFILHSREIYFTASNG